VKQEEDKIMRRILILAAMTLIAILVVGGVAGADLTSQILITNSGQGAESAMVNTLCRIQKIPATLNDTIEAADLAGKDGKALFSFVVIVVGYSGKGMGAAGINLDQEMLRTTALLKKAQALKIPIIAMHIGGYDRRGESSDKLIKEVLKYANHAVFVTSGNYLDSVAFEKNKPDNLLNNSLPKGITPKIVDKIGGTIVPLKEILGL
jgi:hypothetical protein